MEIDPQDLRDILREELAAGSLHFDSEELEKVVRNAVSETLTSLGIQPDDPVEMQKDMLFLRSVRETAESVRKKGILTAIGVLVVATLAAIWAGIRAGLGG